jgi:hypothetical protein
LIPFNSSSAVDRTQLGTPIKPVGQRQPAMRTQSRTLRSASRPRSTAGLIVVDEKVSMAQLIDEFIPIGANITLRSMGTKTRAHNESSRVLETARP